MRGGLPAGLLLALAVLFLVLGYQLVALVLAVVAVVLFVV